MKPCLSSYNNANRPRKDEPSCASEWQLSIPSHMSVDGKDDAHAIEDSAKTSLICVGAPSSTISISWLVSKHSKLTFRMPLDYLTGVLDPIDKAHCPGNYPWDELFAFCSMKEERQWEYQQDGRTMERR